LQSVPQHWQVIPLRHLVKITTGGRDTQDRSDDGIYPFYVRSMNVERIDTYSRDEEAVLTSGDGAGVGKVFHHVNGKFDLHQRMYAFTNFKKMSGRFFYHYLKTFFHLQMTQWSAKSTVDSVRMPFLKSMLFAIPPEAEQEILLEKIDVSSIRTTKLVEATHRSISRLVEFRSALITSAVTGQVDMTTWGKQGRTDRRLDEIQEATRA
jgi:type I restriction enzyme S subunit